MKYLSIILGLIVAIAVTSQIPAWTNTFGGYVDDLANDIIELSSGTFMLAGYTKSSGEGGADGFVVNMDTNGDSLGCKTFGGASDDAFESIAEMSDGFIIAGHTASFGAGDYDWWIVKTDFNGDTMWTKTFGTAGDDKCYDVCTVSSGGMVFIGYIYDTYSDVWMIRTNDAGDTLWTKRYGGTYEDIGYHIIETADKGFIIGAKTKSYGNGGSDMWIIKTDSLGNVEWDETFGGMSNEMCYDAIETSDGGYLATGTGNSDGEGYYDFYTVKLDSNGDSLWMDIWGGIGYDYAYSCMEDVLGRYVIGGQFSFSMCYRILSQDGDSVETTVYEDPTTQWCKDMIAYDNAIILIGATNGAGNGFLDFYALKTENLTGLKSEYAETHNDNIQVYMLSCGKLKVISNIYTDMGISIYNINGSLVHACNMYVEKGSNEMDVSGLKPGVYLLRTTVDGTLQNRKIVLLK